MKYITLTSKDQVTVSDEDYGWLSQFTWMLNNNGYAYRKAYHGKVDGKYKYSNHLMHRDILGLRASNIYADHINRNKLDNRRDNLRVCTPQENPRNSRLFITNKSGFRGVSWYEPYGKWRASISHGNKTHNLGYFFNKEEAARVYNLKAKELHGKFASLNIL